jgi:hypothetical protein
MALPLMPTCKNGPPNQKQPSKVIDGIDEKSAVVKIYDNLQFVFFFKIIEITISMRSPKSNCCRNLFSQHDTLDSLASYLGNFAQDYLVPLNVRCRLDVPLQLPHWPINAEMRHNIFLAFKETLHNVVKHSGATETSIIFSTAYESFTLMVRDNGKGFDPANLPTRTGRGNGLKNMRQRLEKIGGQCEISSTPNAGTEIKFFISVPLTKIFETSAHVIN